MSWDKFIEYLFIGFSFGLGFAAGTALFGGLLSLFGRGPQRPTVVR